MDANIFEIKKVVLGEWLLNHRHNIYYSLNERKLISCMGAIWRLKLLLRAVCILYKKFRGLTQKTPFI